MMQTQGQSLIELLIALALSLFLLGIVGVALQSAQKTANITHALVENQEAGRSVYYLLQQDLQKTDSQILNPKSIPIDLQKRFAKDTQGLFIQLNEKNHSKIKIVYYVTKEDEKNHHGISILQLQRKNLSISSHHQTAMVMGLSGFHLDYGVIHNQQLLFLPAKKISDWQAVQVVKVRLTTIFFAEGKPLKTNWLFTLGVRQDADEKH